MQTELPTSVFTVRIALAPLLKGNTKYHCNIHLSCTRMGTQVRYLKIIEKSGYQALPWVRYITKHGKYELRMT